MGGKFCYDNGLRVRDYCLCLKDNKKLKYCCLIGGKFFCCELVGVYNEVRWVGFKELFYFFNLLMN